MDKYVNHTKPLDYLQKKEAQKMDNDYISREPFRNNIEDILNDDSCPLHIAATIDQYLDAETAIDVVKVVRCQECVFGDVAKHNKNAYWCCLHDYLTTPYGFCNGGKKKEYKADG